MRALTLKQPWAWAIVEQGKRVENRTWPPPKDAFGERIALHAGLKLERAKVKVLERKLGIALPEVFDRAAIVGTAVLHMAARRKVSSSILSWPQELDTWWADGMWMWVLRDVRQLREPILCTGKLGLWQLTRRQENAVLHAPYRRRLWTPE